MIVVRARINHMGKDITNQLVEKLRGREYGLQLDEATDSNKDAHLICYVRFFDDNSMIDDLLFSKPIMTRATSKNLFQILNSFITEHNIEQALASRYANPDHDAVMRIIVKVVNYIKNTASRARTFKKMCQKMRARKLNRLNISLQGPNKYKIIQDDLIQCFKHLLHSCKTAMQDQNLKGHFPLLNRKLEPFNADMSQPDYPKDESMADLSFDSKAQHLFNAMSLVDFWLSMQHKYPDLSENALREFIVFTTSYLCETDINSDATKIGHTLPIESIKNGRDDAGGDIGNRNDSVDISRPDGYDNINITRDPDGPVDS
ncbi:hypothetical protein SSS_05324 [Sarcoptes scabiei]|uniref:DUF4371 domain-containing protein n=1 Tax=Sarcoptes scabiei TaxID=52283 RepID=A0A834VC28_SARSC|nr:hypothetical protein SSS_05324 [Sarcoptes scabiei]